MSKSHSTAPRRTKKTHAAAADRKRKVRELAAKRKHMTAVTAFWEGECNTFPTNPPEAKTRLETKVTGPARRRTRGNRG